MIKVYFYYPVYYINLFLFNIRNIPYFGKLTNNIDKMSKTEMRYIHDKWLICNFL